MSYCCDNCALYVKPGTHATTVVLETRKKVYPPRPKANTFVPRDQPGRKVTVDDPGGVGFEIVKEGKFCPPCARKHNAQAA